MENWLQGFTMGLAYVAPIGLQNMFVINSALVTGFRRSLLTALIVTFFDITLALACFWGVGMVMQHHLWLRMLILLAGSLIVLYIGVGLLRAAPADIADSGQAMSVGKTVYSAFVVTWCNPQALIDGTMMLGAFHATLSKAAAMPFISGVCMASCMWFSFLTILVSAMRSHLSIKVLRGVNLVCGAIIILYGLKLLYNFIQML